MCTGRVDLSFPLRAFLNGADGVFVGGCWPGECHYITEGNYDALGNMHLLRNLMQRIGLDPRRLRLEWVAASEGSRFAEVMDDFTKELDVLGPLGQSEGLEEEALMAQLESLDKMVPQLKLLVREKLEVKVKSEEAYAKLYASPKTDKLISDLVDDPLSSSDELPGYYIDPEKCVACMICMKKCPIKAIDGAFKTIHVIDQDQCTHCGTCFYACPPRLDAVRKIAPGDEFPAPISEEQRLVIPTPKKKKKKKKKVSEEAETGL